MATRIDVPIYGLMHTTVRDAAYEIVLADLHRQLNELDYQIAMTERERLRFQAQQKNTVL